MARRAAKTEAASTLTVTPATATPSRRPTFCIGPTRICDPSATPTPTPEVEVIDDYGRQTACSPFILHILPAIELWFWENAAQWSPDGTVVFFSQGPVVYSAAADGSQVAVVADASARIRSTVTSDVDIYGPMTSFDLSPRDDRLAYATCEFRQRGPSEGTTEHRYAIATVGTDGGPVQQLTRNWGFENYPSWSPDGTRIAFLATDDVHRRVGETYLIVVAADGSGRRRIQTQYAVVMHPPQWSPDGEWLAVVGMGPNADYYVGRRVLYTLRLDSTEWQRLGRTTSGPSWSANGERLAFVAAEEATGDERLLVTMAADGTKVREVPLADDWKPRYEGEHSILATLNWIPTLAWSPAGDQLLYTCGLQVCVVGLDGTPVGRSPLELASGSVAAWSPDGNRIAVTAGTVWGTPGLEPLRGPALYTMAPDGTDVRVLASYDTDGQIRAAGAPSSGG